MPSINSTLSARRSTPHRGPSAFSSRSVQSGSWNRLSTARRSLGSGSGSVVGLSSAAGLIMSGEAGNRIGQEKMAMQGLNERLARYLEKVNSLESSNRELELQISALMEERKPVDRNINPMLAQAHILNKQIEDLTMGSAAIMLQIDNARLSAEDFKMKLDSEALVRQAVENDIDRLRQVQEDYAVNASSLCNETDLLTEEILFLKKNHGEELSGLKAHLKNERVSVSVSSSEEADITDAVTKVRTQYEGLMAKNKAEAQSWYESQLQVVNNQVQLNTKELDSFKAEFNMKRQTMQGLEVELETLKSQVIGLENILGETESRNADELRKMQLTISQREMRLIELRDEMHRSKENYDDLLKIKQTLEAEIAEYRRLLNGNLSVTPAPPPRTPTPPPEITTRKTIKVITTTLVDGKVVDESSEVSEYSEQKQK
ncbi:keratin, type I cytoskeletal 18-B-like [Amblyraja radiata]|uniref:keratin, type I cytoskeletal 18-B-like n=1 Tax=Amblyraja radiata TaxID=386614 RepID=UPI001402D3D6|nr:keratin, type I cytoskeletal 18-B-like [Amblyraja radiata]